MNSLLTILSLVTRIVSTTQQVFRKYLLGNVQAIKSTAPTLSSLSLSPDL